MSEMFAFDNMRVFCCCFFFVDCLCLNAAIRGKEERTDSWKEQKNAHGFLHVMEGRDVV